MALSESSIFQTGSIAEISQRLLLLAQRRSSGLARVEYSSEFARERVIEELKVTLARQGIAVHEISLLSYQAPDDLVAYLLEELSRLESGVVSVTGFAIAFNRQVPLPDALRVLNFNRERLIAFPLQQIWWMTPVFLQTAIHAMPDLNSWFSPKLRLTEVVFTQTEPLQLLSTERNLTNIDDARQRSQQLIERFEKARNEGAPTEALLKTYLLPALEALAEVGAQKEYVT